MLYATNHGACSQVLVLEERDITNVDAFLKKLQHPPYLLCFHGGGTAIANKWVRQLRFYAVAAGRQLPYNTPEHLPE
jgi:hypothetical protein